MQSIKKEKGITLIVLVITIIVLGILTFVIATNITPYNNERTKVKFETDLGSLEEEINQYYARLREIPIINRYIISDEMKSYTNVNDNENYYVIDLNKLNVKLNYGKDYEIIKQKDKTEVISNELSDVYIINEQSNTIYYAKGIEFDGKTYYRLTEVYTQI